MQPILLLLSNAKIVAKRKFLFENQKYHRRRFPKKHERFSERKEIFSRSEPDTNLLNIFAIVSFLRRDENLTKHVCGSEVRER
jgi:hypothetical protein